MRITRAYRFAASHRLHSPALADDANAALYGKCNNPYGHGHDYILHITVTGPLDPLTGRIIAVGTLDAYVEERLLSIYDHSDLNRDVPEFQGVPTTENLAADADRRLRERWPFAPVILERISIQETERNRIEFRHRD